MFSKKEETRTPFTIERCEGCKKEHKRKFKTGDYLFRNSSTCPTCKAQMKIVKIFGEIIKE